ncbi:putative 4-carboxymuconolactone decarboxylase [Diaporthe ampelina]|uniref:Putative 4-carboxymuconolactone decarboxylase n=1 Tax=Diaporthe ampelina TaxID=1214573 RepID=A0A0G2FY14_9PEZI|nr:putative 4-carboxymuconolactone decarboxylase [Diaporthe ampelina]
MSQQQGTSGGAAASSSSSSSSPAQAQARQALFDEGYAIRAEVTGAQHVERSWTKASDFSRPMQELATQSGWGLIWGRPGLDRRTRSLLNVAMLVAQGRDAELAVHVKGAIRNGATETEIQEAILQASIYAGLPAGMAGTRVADRALQELKDEGEETRSS